ncbi:MAG TPA: Clp protease N-terminal domain-containing protein, partial [Solirubrobacterales bacterium]|nr:Clp protease N-terminal domain-containing protein [Solirubrobacterales bacterium]
MQPDRFTTKSQEAVAAAQALAAERRNAELTPAHLLVALLRQEGGMATPVLQKLDVDVTATTAAAVQRVEDLPKLSEPAEVRASPQLLAVLQAAEKEMAQAGDSYITVGHLLLALAGADSGIGDLLPEREPLRKAVGEVQGPGHVTSPNAEDNAQALEKFGRDLTADARDGKLDPVIGRDEEIRRVIQVLS